MLTNLKISNFAIIENIDLALEPGFSVITGETGAGKSIIIGAINLIIGARLDAKSLINKEKKTVIEATFNIAGFERLKQIFDDNDLDFDDNECVLRREITPEGKSRIFVNDTPTTLAVVRQIAIQLIDIHSQHANTLLSDEAFQLYLIDTIADNKQLRHDFETVYNLYVQKSRQLKELVSQVNDARKESDYNKFLYNQLAELNLQPGEDEVLEATQLQLANVQRIKETLWSVKNTLDNESCNTVAEFNLAARKLKSIADIVPSVDELSERIESLIIELKDIIESIVGIDDSIVDNPKELERVEDRISAIHVQKKKHSVDSVDDLLSIQHALMQKIDLAANSEIDVETIQNELEKLRQQLISLGEKLTQSRKEAAGVFELELIEMARPLGLKHINCFFKFSPTEFTAKGCDSVELQIAINKNQELSSISETASGGEISRMMLCVKGLLAKRVNMPTIIFDEIDTGVSGEIAVKMANLMATMAERMQVITITHLPQVAATGRTHYKVYKTDTDNSTVTSIVRLDEEQRVQEIAGMLGDSTISKAALDNAKELLKVRNE